MNTKDIKVNQASEVATKLPEPEVKNVEKPSASAWLPAVNPRKLRSRAKDQQAGIAMITR